MSTVAATGDQLRALNALDENQGPVLMLNLLRYREQANYEADSGETPCSGREAYERYGAHVLALIDRVGGKPCLSASALVTVIAPDSEQWDDMIIVRYPSVAAFKSMIFSEDYLAISFHRDAGLADSRLVITQAQLLDFSE